MIFNHVCANERNIKSSWTDIYIKQKKLKNCKKIFVCLFVVFLKKRKIYNWDKIDIYFKIRNFFYNNTSI